MDYEKKALALVNVHKHTLDIIDRLQRLAFDETITDNESAELVRRMIKDLVRLLAKTTEHLAAPDLIVPVMPQPAGFNTPP